MVRLPLSPYEVAMVSMAQVDRDDGIPAHQLPAASVAAAEPAAAAGADALRGNAAHGMLSHERAVCATFCSLPVSGWIYSSATGVQVVYLGLFPLPDLVAKDRALAAVLKVTHLTLNSALFAIVCVHVVAALRHHYVQHDDVLHRMLPMSRTR